MDQIRRRRNLPHLETDGGIYFVTFRLADSLPRLALLRIYNGIHPNPDSNSKTARHLPARRLSPRIEKFLDSGAGACVLARPDIAFVVARSLATFAGTRYRLFAWCIMPNHVHVVLQPSDAWSLSRIIHSWKSFTVTRANELLKRTGEFWQREYCDHLVRDGNDFTRLVRCILENPARAGLANWPWAGTAPFVAPASCRRF
jgi:REP element-mobilizing transposase RayT